MTEWVCLLAVVAAIVLVVALNRDPTAPRADAAATDEVTQTPQPDPGSTARPTKAEKRQARKAAAAQRVATLMEAHGCWTGAAPAGVVPTHALVTLPGAEPALADADVGYGIWLEGDPEKPHGFCP